MPCFQCRQHFLQRHPLLRTSFLPFPQTISLQSIAVLTLGLLSNPHAPARAPVCTGGRESSPGYTGLWQTVRVVPTLCRLSQISRFTLQQPQLPLCEVLTPASAPLLRGCRSGPVHSPPLFPFSSFILLIFAWFQWSGTPASFSWCSARSSASEEVFLIYL